MGTKSPHFSNNSCCLSNVFLEVSQPIPWAFFFFGGEAWHSFRCFSWRTYSIWTKIVPTPQLLPPNNPPKQTTKKQNFKTMENFEKLSIPNSWKTAKKYAPKTTTSFRILAFWTPTKVEPSGRVGPGVYCLYGQGRWLGSSPRTCPNWAGKCVFFESKVQKKNSLSSEHDKSTWKWMVGILVSFLLGPGLFSGANC